MKAKLSLFLLMFFVSLPSFSGDSSIYLPGNKILPLNEFKIHVPKLPKVKNGYHVKCHIDITPNVQDGYVQMNFLVLGIGSANYGNMTLNGKPIRNGLGGVADLNAGTNQFEMNIGTSSTVDGADILFENLSDHIVANVAECFLYD